MTKITITVHDDGRAEVYGVKGQSFNNLVRGAAVYIDSIAEYTKAHKSEILVNVTNELELIGKVSDDEYLSFFNIEDKKPVEILLRLTACIKAVEKAQGIPSEKIIQGITAMVEIIEKLSDLVEDTYYIKTMLSPIFKEDTE